MSGSAREPAAVVSFRIEAGEIHKTSVVDFTILELQILPFWLVCSIDPEGGGAAA